MFSKLMQLARHSAVYGLGSIASKLLAILLLPLYVRYLEPSSYGIAEAVLMLDLFTVALIKLGLQNSMMRFWFEQKDLGRGDQVIRTVVTALAVTSVVGGLVLVVAARPLAGFFLRDPDLYRYIWIAAFGVGCSTIYQTLTSIFRLQQRPTAFVTCSLSNILASALLTVTFVVAFDWNATGLLLGNFLGTFVLIPPVAFVQRRYIRPTLGGDLLPNMLRFGLPTMPMAIANQGLTLIDRTVLARYAGLSQLGLYALGSRVAQVVMLVVIALQMSWQPFAYSIKDDEEARATYAVVMSWFVASIGWLVVAAALLAEPLVRLATVPTYYPAARAVPLLALAAGVYGVYFIAGIGAGRVKKTGYHVLVASLALGTSLVANLVLVPRYGMLGAAVAALCANTVLSLSMVIRAQRVFHVPYETGRLARALAIIIVMVSLPAVIPHTGWAATAGRIALVAAYPGLLYLVGFVDRSQIEFLRDRLRQRRDRRAAAIIDPDAG